MHLLRWLTLAGAVVLYVSLPVAASEPFRAEQLDTGVWAVVPTTAGDGRTNSLVVEQARGLVVVDAQPSVAAAREMLETIAGLSSKPIRYLVYSHAHADAVGGAAAFPGDTIRVAASQVFDSLSDPRTDPGGEQRERSGTAWARPSIPLPELVIAGVVDLEDSERTVRLLPQPHAHTPGDMVVWLPSSKVMAVGDVIAGDRNPYGSDADLSKWVNTVNAILRQQPTRVLPLRGPVLDRAGVVAFRDGLAWLRSQVQIAVRKQIPAEEIPAWLIQQDGAARYFDLGSDPMYLSTLVELSVEEIRAFQRKTAD